MGAGKKKTIILLTVFLAAVFISVLGNREVGSFEQGGSTIQAASLPILCFDYQDEYINPLYGYLSETMTGAADQCVFPFLGDSLSLQGCLINGTEQPLSVAYELRNEDGSRLVAHGKVSSFERNTQGTSFTLSFENILTEDVYYSLRLKLTTASRTAWYFTRIMKLSDPETLPLLTDYAVRMSENLLAGTDLRQYIAKLETDTKSDKNTLAEVSIRSSAEQLSWGSAEPKRTSRVWLTIEAIQDKYAYVSLRYLVEAEEGESHPVSLRVKESMTLQSERGTVYLLSYNRLAEELWSFQENSVITSGFLLGLQHFDSLQAMRDEKERFTAFTAAGELYLYDASETTLTRIFSFRSTGEHSLRTLMDDYSIKIMDVHENGDVEFAVSGYMNGGIWEGMSGISYLLYEAEKGRLSEYVSLQSQYAPALVQEESNTIFVKGNDHFLYFLFNGQLLAMDISTGETAVLVSDQKKNHLVINSEGNAFAWSSDSNLAMPSTVRVMDLKDNTSEILTAREGEFILPLGYMQEDLLIGTGKREQALLSDGYEQQPYLTSFVIYGENMETVYQYSLDDSYIGHVEIDKEKVLVHRFTWYQGKYYYVPVDVMLRSDGGRTAVTAFSEYYDASLKRLAVLSYLKLPSSLRIENESVTSFIRGERLSLSNSKERTESGVRYFAYAHESLLGSFSEPGEAIAAAAPEFGYVIREDGVLFWQWPTRREERIVAPTPELLEETGKRSSLTGARFRQLVYYFNKGAVVLWISPDQGKQWVIGYDWQNVVFYDPETAETSRILQSAFDEALERDNNYLFLFEP